MLKLPSPSAVSGMSWSHRWLRCMPVKNLFRRLMNRLRPAKPVTLPADLVRQTLSNRQVQSRLLANMTQHNRLYQHLKSNHQP